MAIYYEADAINDLKKIVAYGKKQGYPKAAKYATALRVKISIIGTHPEGGRPGRVPGTRELVIAGTPYIAVYQIDGNDQRVRRVLHGSQQWP
ncbi:type II toxin-antitoxin system RelE/ParE family toxin [Xanthomonas euvesicatoria]|uniref:type II toxin-antitoxin system RelE/ParE family toxin n=1 Tax=Xanthomonas euvesicatoria TaxID=456327 RepID=UPI0038929AE3